MPIKQEVVDQLTGHWQIGLFEAPCKAPMSFCYGCCCICCMASQQRLKILDVIGEPYICCGGLFPCGPLGEPQDRNCVYAEACCCSGLAVSGNRFLIQTRFDRQNTACDDCILWTVCLASWIVCLLQCVGCDVPEEIENCVDCMVMVVDGCMLAQQQTEVDYVVKNGYGGPPQHIIGALSPFQQQVASQGKPAQQTMGGMGGAAVVGGAAVAGGAGAAAAMGAFGGGGKPQQQQQQMHGKAVPPPQVMGSAGGQPGFMGTISPSGATWMQYCQSAGAPRLDNRGLVTGPWGECIAWAKVFEIQNPNWESMPEYRDDGPCGQVIDALCQAGGSSEAGERLEEACQQAHAQGRPLPVINQTV